MTGPMSETVTGARLSGARLSSFLYDTIKTRLLEGHYGAGAKVVVEELRHEFGVSKQPVMDALRRLATEKLVAIVPQAGCHVIAYGPQEVADFYLLFGDFEGTIAAVAAERRTPEQVTHLDTISDRVDKLIASNDPSIRAHGYRVHNREFHGAIHAMAHSRIMEETSQRMWDMSDFLINTAGIANPLASALPQRQCDHRAITDAIRDGDAERARQAMRDHILKTVDVIDAERSAATA